MTTRDPNPLECAVHWASYTRATGLAGSRLDRTDVEMSSKQVEPDRMSGMTRSITHLIDLAGVNWDLLGWLEKAPKSLLVTV